MKESIEKLIKEAIATKNKQLIHIAEEKARLHETYTEIFTKEKMLEREMNAQCLQCGKHLGYSWTESKSEGGLGYHIHICLECRKGEPGNANNKRTSKNLRRVGRDHEKTVQHKGVTDAKTK
jgi:hypothetical protein